MRAEKNEYSAGITDKVVVTDRLVLLQDLVP